MKKKIGSLFSMLMALSVITGGINFPKNSIEVNAVESSDTRLVVDLNANDGRKASYSKNADNWNVAGGTTATTTIDGLTFTLSNGGNVGGDIRSVNCKILQLQSGIYPYLTMDGVTINDCENGGVIKLEISGLSAGTHSIKTFHSCVDNVTVDTMKVSVNGQTTATGVKCPTRVTNENDAGISFSTFNVSDGQTVTVLISPEGSGNAWLNGFEIDGADPFNGISNISPSDKNSHHDKENGLSWKAGNGAKSHDVYIGTDFDSVFNATTNSPEFKGNQTGTTYALDDSYSSINTYYWRVDTVNDSGVVKGAVYSFKVNRLAFPTAEGYGRYARGGRGGRIVEVTNLNDSGEGSLRQALEVEKGPRIVVFRVGGVIELQSRLCIPDDGGDVYVAGQTAPGDGITLINYDFGAMGSSDVIIRDIRTRVGDMNGTSTGGMGLGSCNNSIIDHCSISWATDEGFSSRSAQNITFQWNIIGESLNESVHYNADNREETEPHSFAASIGGYTGSFHHNLLIDNTGRNWSLAGAMEQDAKTYGGQLDIRNNVVYNWRDRTTDGGVKRLNFVNNYYKAGAVSSTDMHIVSLDGNELGTDDMQMMYVDGNKMVAHDGTVLLESTDNAWDKGKAKSGGKNSTDADVRSDTPFFESYVNTQSADDAYKSIIASVGAGGTSATGWDYIDSRYINEVKNNTYTYTGSKAGLKGIIDSQNDVGGYPNESTFEYSTNAPVDTDHDGMSDEWEELHGLNPNDAFDGSIVSLSADDYTNVEMYLNELAGDNVEYNGNTTPSTIKNGAVINTANSYRIKNVNSGLYLEIADTATNGTNVYQSDLGETAWTLVDAGDGYYKIYLKDQNYLLDIDYGKIDNGTNIGIWGNTDCDAQSFKFVDNGDGTYTIVTKPTDDASCLGVESGSTEIGANVVQWECNGSDDQKWILETYIEKLNGNLIKNLAVDSSANCDKWNINLNTNVGSKVFGDRDVTYTEIPAILDSSESILTSCDDKALTGNQAEFDAGDDISVYIALDSRVTTAPEWLSDWIKTEFIATNSNNVTFYLYKKDFSKNEKVTLGTNGQTSGCVNYTVFVTTQEDIISTTEPTSESDSLKGDANCDGKVAVADAVAVSAYVSNATKNTLTEQGIINSDVHAIGNGLNASDALMIQQYSTGIIDSLN